MNTVYFLNTIMGNLFHTQETPPIPEKYYIGLTYDDPAVQGEYAREPETSGTGYCRKELTSLSEPSNGVVTNTDSISFDNSIANWGAMNYYVVYDAEQGGNLLFFGKLSEPRTVEANTILTIKSNELAITLRNASE